MRSFPLQQISFVSMTPEDSINSIVILALSSEGEGGRGRIAEEYVINVSICIRYICGLFIYFLQSLAQRDHISFHLLAVLTF